jgi:hypothetical protein
MNIAEMFRQMANHLESAVTTDKLALEPTAPTATKEYEAARNKRTRALRERGKEIGLGLVDYFSGYHFETDALLWVFSGFMYSMQNQYFGARRWGEINVVRYQKELDETATRGGDAPMYEVDQAKIAESRIEYQERQAEQYEILFYAAECAWTAVADAHSKAGKEIRRIPQQRIGEKDYQKWLSDIEARDQQSFQARRANERAAVVDSHRALRNTGFSFLPQDDETPDEATAAAS